MMIFKKRVFPYLAVAVILLIALFSYFSYSHMSFSASEADFKVRRNSEIRQIKLMRGEESVLLTNEQPESWLINKDFTANMSAIEQLRSIMNALEIRHPSSLTQRDSLHREMQKNGIRVQIFLRNYLINAAGMRLLGYNRLYQDFWVGDDVNIVDNTGVYMKKHGSDVSFIMYVPGWEGSIGNIFSTEIRNWLSPVIIDFGPEELKSVKLIYPGEEEKSFKLTADKSLNLSIQSLQYNDYLPAQEIDTMKVLRFLSSFKELHYESLADENGDSLRQKLMIPEVWASLQIETQQGRVLSFDLFKRKPDPEYQSIETDLPYDPNRFYIKLSENQYALAQFYVFNRILRSHDWFKVSH